MTEPRQRRILVARKTSVNLTTTILPRLADRQSRSNFWFTPMFTHAETSFFTVMNQRIRDLTGQRFGNWTVLQLSHTTGTKTVWLCRCGTCGKTKRIVSYHLCSGASRGCFDCSLAKRRGVPSPRRTHGKSKDITYVSWAHMRTRCLSAEHNCFKNYGGRGITICERWLNSVENFIADMGPRPSRKHSLERIDVNGNYEPSNCKWATTGEQSINRRDTVRLTILGITKTSFEWAMQFNLNPKLLYHRIRAGWPIEDLSLPVFSKGQKRHRPQFNTNWGDQFLIRK